MTLWQIWWLALGIKTALLPFLPITPDEAYYMAWARHPALSYFDHPPYISWVMAAGLPFWKTALTVRWPGVVLNHLTFIPWIGILKRLKFSPKAQIYWMLLILLGPLTGLGAFVITPDTPLIFFWSASLWALLWTMDNPTVSRWTVLGVFIGLGLLSKYTMVLFFPATLLWLIWENEWRQIAKPGPWVALIVAFLFFSPVIIWNLQHEMASFAFQGHHGLSSTGYHPLWTLEYLSGQLGLLNPLAAILALWAIVKTYHRRKFLTVFGLFPLLFFFITSFKGRVEANWPVCAYPCLMALAAAGWDEEFMAPKARVLLKSAVALSSVFLAVGLSHLIHPWLPIPAQKDHSAITREWLPDVAALKDLHPLYARSYQMAAFLSYYRPKDREVFKLAGLDRKDFYDFIPESHPHEPAYLVLGENELLPDQLKEIYVLSDPRPLPDHLVVYNLALRDTHGAFRSALQGISAGAPGNAEGTHAGNSPGELQ